MKSRDDFIAREIRSKCSAATWIVSD